VFTSLNNIYSSKSSELQHNDSLTVPSSVFSKNSTFSHLWPTDLKT